MEDRILLADDSEIVLGMLRVQLAAEGFDVSTSLSGTDAVALAIDKGPFDLFILDVMMPDMTGFEVTRRLRQEASCVETPVLLLTSLDGTGDKVTGLEAGADDFLTKTVSHPELVARVRNLVAMGKLRKRQSSARATAASMVGARGTSPTNAAPHVYVVHDDLEVRAQLLSLCHRELQLGPNASDVAGGLSHLTRTATDVVLISYARAIEGQQTMADVLHGWESPPAILVVDPAPSAERRITAYQCGAEDYIAQNTPSEEIAARLMGALRRRRRYRSIESARDQALEAAITDPLTHLYNRGFFEEVLRGECKRARRYDQAAAVVLLDIDHFKRVNDTWGHPAGDEVLREVARRIEKTLRSSDLAARFGGEEFIMLLPSTDAAGAMLAANRVRVALEEAPFEVGVDELRVTASFGVAITAADTDDPRRLVELADAALYVAKRGGRNQVVMSGAPDNPKVLARCPLCDAQALLAQLLSEDLDHPMAALRAAVYLTPSLPDEATNTIVQGVRAGANEVLEQLALLESTLNAAPHDRSCPESRRTTAEEVARAHARRSS